MKKTAIKMEIKKHNAPVLDSRLRGNDEKGTEPEKDGDSLIPFGKRYS